MHTYPADEGQISAIERGRVCEAVVPQPPGTSLTVGDVVLFAHSQSRGGQPSRYVMGGDSVLIAINGITDLGAIDPATGQALVRLVWEPPGQPGTPSASTGRSSRPPVRG